MASATTIVSYLGEGTLANRPASPGISATALGFYYATDNATLYLWDGSAWQTIVGAGGAAITASGIALTSPFTFSGLVGKNVPLASAFTFVNQNSATLTDNTNGPLVWKCTTSLGSVQLSLVKRTTGGGAFTITGHFAYSLSDVPAFTFFGVTDGTKCSGIVFARNDGGGNSPFIKMQIQQWTSATSFSATVATIVPYMPNPAWLRIVYSTGAHSLSYEYSVDGFTWIVAYLDTSPYLVPTDTCFGANINAGAASAPALMSFDYYVKS